MNIALVGTGNVAVVLSRLLVSAGHSIIEVIGRNTSRHRIFTVTGGKFKTIYETISPEAHLCVIAVSDGAIAEVAGRLQVKHTLVVHTSGATSKEVLNRFENYGVLYPLQSLRKEMEMIPLIPFFVDANTDRGIEMLSQLAQSTGNPVTIANDEQRLLYHLSAVLCSNFTNHLYALTEDFCKRKEIDFKSLLPLIQETAQRLRYFPPAQMQTGPAVRNDTITLQRHLQLLESLPQLHEVYELLTESIQQFRKESDRE